MNLRIRYESFRKESIPPNYFNKRTKPQKTIQNKPQDKVKRAPNTLMKGLDMEVRLKRSKSQQQSLRYKYHPHLIKKARSRSHILKSSNWLQPDKPIRRRSSEGLIFGQNSYKLNQINEYLTVTIIRQHAHQREQENRERRRRAYKLQTMTKASKEPEKKKDVNYNITKQTANPKSKGRAYISNNSHLKNKQQVRHKPQMSKDLNNSYRLVSESSSPKNIPIIVKEQKLSHQNSIPLYMNNILLTDEIIESEPVQEKKSPTKSKETFSQKGFYRQRSSEMVSGSRASQDKSLLAGDPSMSIDELDIKINTLLRIVKQRQVLRKISGAVDDFNIQYTTVEDFSPMIKKPNMLQRQRTLKNPQYCGNQNESRNSSGSLSSVKQQKYRIILQNKQQTLQVMMSQDKLKFNKTMQKFVNSYTKTPQPKSPIEPAIPKSLNSYGQISIGQDKRSFIASLQTQTFISGQSLRTQHHNTQVFHTRAEKNPTDFKALFMRKSCHDLLVNSVRVKTTPLTPYGRLLIKQKPQTRGSMS